MNNDIKRTIREALEFWRAGLEFDEERMHIDAALSALDEPPIPLGVREAVITLCENDEYHWAARLLRKWLDAQEPTLQPDTLRDYPAIPPDVDALTKRIKELELQVYNIEFILKHSREEQEASDELEALIDQLEHRKLKSPCQA